jgi:hypothetical protein
MKLLTLALLVPLCSCEDTAYVVASRDLTPGTDLQKSDMTMAQIESRSVRKTLPSGAIRCWFDCRDRAVGHRVLQAIHKSEFIRINHNIDP